MSDALVTRTRPREHSWRGACAALVVLGAVVAYAWLVPLLAPSAWQDVDLSAARQAPSWAHWAGTDHAGRDLFVRVALGLRVSLLIAALCALSSTLLGMLVGTLAAALGGVWDSVLMRLTDATNALPHLVLGLVIVAFFPGSVVAIVASIALTHWPQVARLVRSIALTTHAMEYVDASYLAGASRWDVVRRHLLPSAAGQGVVAMVLLLPHAIWHESTLSFLGLGLPPDQPSLGTLLQISQGEVFVGAWWSLVHPAAMLVLTTLAVSGLGSVARRRIAPVATGVTR